MSSTYMSSVFRSGSPSNDAGPLVERTAPTLTWAAADPAVTDAARPISKAAIVMFFGIAKSSLFTCGFAHNEHRHARELFGSLRRSGYFCLALSQAQQKIELNVQRPLSV